MSKIVDFNSIYEKSEDAKNQLIYMAEQYEILIEELAELDDSESIQILRSELVPVGYDYITDWYFEDGLQRKTLHIDFDDDEEEIAYKKELLQFYLEDLPKLEQTTVRQAMEELRYMRQVVNDELKDWY